MEAVLGVFLGISLSAAAGFRVFVPPLVVGLIARTTTFDLPANLVWMQTTPALLLFGAATLIEVTAFYVPLVDNVLDVIAGPLAVLAGVLMTGAFAADLDPVLRWSLALVAGGGAAAGVHALTSLTRLLSTGATGGLANPVVATSENTAATGLSLLAVFLPVVAFVLVVVILMYAFRRVRRVRALRARPS